MSINRLFRVLLLLLPACLLFTGCMERRSIREDSVAEALPEIDPEAGIQRDVAASIYYRLSGEPYLVPVYADIPVHINETPEEAIVRAVLSTGIIEQQTYLTSAFPENTEIVEVTKDNNILYVTLSEEYMNKAVLADAEQEAEKLLLEQYITQEEHDLRLQKMEEEILIQRRMGLYSIINSVTAYDPSLRVLLSVEKQGGDSERIRYDELGIENENDLSSNLLEPLSFEESAIATPESMLECVLRHVMHGKMENAYFWFADGEGNKPSFESFEEMLQGTERIAAFEMSGYSFGSNVNYAYAEADITFVRVSDGKEVTRLKRIRMLKEGEIYRVDYNSFALAMEGKVS